MILMVNCNEGNDTSAIETSHETSVMLYCSTSLTATASARLNVAEGTDFYTTPAKKASILIIGCNVFANHKQNMAVFGKYAQSSHKTQDSNVLSMKSSIRKYAAKTWL